MNFIAKLLFEVLVYAYHVVSRNSLFKIYSCRIYTAFVSRKSLILFLLPTPVYYHVIELH